MWGGKEEEQQRGDECDESLSVTSNFRNIERSDKWCVAQHAEGFPFEYAATNSLVTAGPGPLRERIHRSESVPKR